MIEPHDPRMACVRQALRRLGPADTRRALKELLTHHSGERVVLFPRFVRGLMAGVIVMLSLAGATIIHGIRSSYSTDSVVLEAAATSDPVGIRAADSLDRPGAVSLGNGELVIPVGKSTVFRITEKTHARTVVSLEQGAVQLRIRHDGRRVFRVRAGTVEIEDLGTIFRVERLSDGKVHVAVLEGQVAVAYPIPGGLRRQDLFEGEDQVFPPAVEATGDAPASEPIATSTSTQDRKRVGANDSWRALAHEGQYDRAFRVLQRGHFRAVGDDPGEILLAADVARLSRNAGASVAPLRRFLDRYPNDPRVPAAAFTLGWVLLKDVRQPNAAALAFATAERTAPLGNLAEDAAARGAEAWYQAGDVRRAKSQVLRYLRTYPNGRYRTLLGRLIEER